MEKRFDKFKRIVEFIEVTDYEAGYSASGLTTWAYSASGLTENGVHSASGLTVKRAYCTSLLTAKRVYSV